FALGAEVLLEIVFVAVLVIRLVVVGDRILAIAVVVPIRRLGLRRFGGRQFVLPHLRLVIVTAERRGGRGAGAVTPAAPPLRTPCGRRLRPVILRIGARSGPATDVPGLVSRIDAAAQRVADASAILFPRFPRLTNWFPVPSVGKGGASLLIPVTRRSASGCAVVRFPPQPVPALPRALPLVLPRFARCPLLPRSRFAPAPPIRGIAVGPVAGRPSGAAGDTRTAFAGPVRRPPVGGNGSAALACQIRPADSRRLRIAVAPAREWF